MTQDAAAPRAPVLATIVLAAGGSTRMTGGHKLLEIVEGRPLVTWSVRAALEASLGPVVVVTGDRAREVEAAVPPEASCVEHPGWRSGMAGSLRVGVDALPSEIDAFAISLGDMPAVRPAHYRALRAAWTPGRIVVPTHDGRRGHPVIWPADLRPEMADLHGDRGARPLLDRHADLVMEVPIPDPAVVSDVDTRADLESVRTALTAIERGRAGR